MALSAFEDPARSPSADELRQTLGPAADLWAALLAQLHASCAPLAELWRHSGAKYGWSLRLVQKDRVILYLTPQRDAFLVGLVLGERAAQAAMAGALPPLALTALTAAPKYAEGHGIRVAVTSQAELEAALALLPYKLLPAPPRAARKAVAKPGGA